MKKKEKDLLIFLDIDGVLNSWGEDHMEKDKASISDEAYKNIRKCHWYLLEDLHEDNINNFNKLIEELNKIFNNINIIITSSWRNLMEEKELVYMLKEAGLRGNILETLDSFSFKNITKEELVFFERGNLVSKYIKNNFNEEEIENTEFLILDDNSFEYKKYNLDGFFYKTNFLKGLTEGDVNVIVKCLIDKGDGENEYKGRDK